MRKMKVIIYNPEKCIGCRLCESVCSIKHTGTASPMRSRIKILKRLEYVFVPVRCRQCEDPICMLICPVNAITIDSKLGIMKLDYDVCRGCRICVEACPFGGAQIDPVERKIFMCDLCEGDPLCVKVCPGEALEFVEESEIVYRKREKIIEMYTKILESYKGLIR